ncbi:MAG: hypothetical protein JWQ48_3343 [Conexibacter sp.]|jgi:hypothetical protein|nr:hypothetical protein [Conexibacter sp.]
MATDPATIDAMEPPRLRLTFEFDLDTDSVSGLLRGGAGDGEPFSGWMALTRAIELQLAAARSTRPAGDEPTSTREAP